MIEYQHVLFTQAETTKSVDNSIVMCAFIPSTKLEYLVVHTQHQWIIVDASSPNVSINKH